MSRASFQAPGVYVVEVASGARPIQAVGTSTAAFVGVAPDASAFLHQAVLVDSWGQFRSKFCPTAKSPLDPPPKIDSTPLALAVFGFFANGGRRCYIVNVGDDDRPVLGGAADRKGIDVLEEIDDVNIVAAPGFTDKIAYKLLIDHCEKMRDRVAILDAPPGITDITFFKKAAAGMPAAGGGAVAGGGGAGAGGTGATAAATATPPPPSKSGQATLYFPWIQALDPFDPGNDPVDTPPSGHIAGVWARTDSLRGVHKAPANEQIAGCVGLTYSVTQSEQEVLNPIGVNCIRSFARDGILIWGARTLAPAGSEWTYINVRRLFNMIEESIRRSTRWVVFEPNDPTLWKAIRRDVSAFLRVIWSDGMLFGATEDKAFYVKCDEETNPPESIDLGYVIIEVGIAPVKPAEFIIFRIGQYAAGSQTSESR